MKQVTKVPYSNRLRKHRMLMGYKQKEVALLLGLQNTNRISRWESGLSVPSTINLFKLSIIYRTFPNELYFEVLLEIRHNLIAKEKRIFSKRRTD